MLLLLLACAMTPDRYTHATIEAICEWGLSCADNTFATYENVDACVEAQEPYLTPYLDCYEASCGRFDAEAARECIAGTDPDACEEGETEACTRVWTDCDDEALATCQTAAAAG